MSGSATAPEAPPRETVLVRLRPHPRALFWPVVLLVTVVGATVWLLGVLPGAPWRWLALAVAAVLITAGFLAPLIRWASRRTIVTTRRVVVRRGLLVRTREELTHASGYRVTLHRGPLQLLFGTGDLALDAGGERRIRLRDVPSAALVQEALGDLVDAAYSAGGTAVGSASSNTSGPVSPRW